jgi:calnexin
MLAVAAVPRVSAELTPLASVDGAAVFEGFDGSWDTRWKVSKDAEFTGSWKHEEYAEPAGVPGDKGIQVGDPAQRHAVSTIFKKPVDPKEGGFVVQYELQMKKTLECGGAYLKLLTASEELDHDGFKADTPYTIMFGPDKCGSTNKVHFIMRHKSPATGEWEEKHLASPPMPKLTMGESHLYTAIVGTDNSVKILIDNEESKSADLLKDGDFSPNVNPPAEIDDPEDKKPSDWIDSAKMADPEASKPDDWDEDAPHMITDPDATKPEAWLDDAPLQVPDPDAKAPDDWDEDEDGEWEAPIVDNPACKEAGCGEWTAPKISNPDYKGKWSAPMIDNPAYIGVWNPAQIANPKYFKDEQPHAMAPIGGIGIELWTMQEGALFDNIVVAHDAAVASKAAEAFTARVDAVKAAKEAKEAEEKAAADAKEAEEADAADAEDEKKDEL